MANLMLRRMCCYVAFVVFAVSSAVVWADQNKNHCAVISIGNCPGQFCDDLQGRVCGSPTGQCTLTICVSNQGACATDPNRKRKQVAVRNTYDCVVGSTHYACFGNFNQSGSEDDGCCDCS
jgi:hypothetical protein